MFKEVILVASTFAWFANTTPTFFYGTLTSFTVDPLQLNTDVVSSLYDTCSETDGNSGIVATGNVCMARLVSYMLQAVATVADGAQSVAIVNSTNNIITRKGNDAYENHRRRLLMRNFKPHTSNALISRLNWRKYVPWT